MVIIIYDQYSYEKFKKKKSIQHYDGTVINYYNTNNSVNGNGD